MLKQIVALLTHRNQFPSSIFEKIGDWFITPVNYFLGLSSFHAIRDNNEKFTYCYPQETTGIDSFYKYYALRAFSGLLSPLALLGFLIKLPGLITSKEMRDIYFNWQTPVNPEYAAIAHNSEESFLAHAWNHKSIMEAAIKQNHANLLMKYIIQSQKQWFIHFKENGYTLGFLGFGLTTMMLTPEIYECVCTVSGKFNRHATLRRKSIEETMNKYLQKLPHSKKQISYISLGAEGLLQELINIHLLLNSGLKNIKIVLVDPKFKTRNKYSEEKQKFIEETQKERAQLFSNFIHAMAKERGAVISIEFFENVHNVPRQCFDIISAVDFDDISESEDDVQYIYPYLKPDGRFYLSFDNYDIVYDDKTHLYSHGVREPQLIRKDKSVSLSPKEPSSLEMAEPTKETIKTLTQIGLFKSSDDSIKQTVIEYLESTMPLTL